MKPEWYVEQSEKFVVIRCDFDIGGRAAGVAESISRVELKNARYPGLMAKVRIDVMDRRRKRMLREADIRVSRYTS